MMETFLPQERPKCFWGSQNTQKRRTRMKKCGLGDLGAPRRSKALKTQLCDPDPSEHQKTSYTYAKVRKRLFATFLFFEKVKNDSLFARAIRGGKLPTEERTFSSQTLQVAEVAPWELFSLQDDTSRTFSYVYDVFACSGSPETRLGVQNAFWSNKCTLGPKDRARGRCCIDEKLGSPNLARI